MNVLILHSRYLSGLVSGENRVVEDEARLLRQAGHDVQTWEPFPAARGAAILRTGAEAVWSVRAAAEVARLVRRHGTEVVHIHNLYPMLSPAVIRSARRGGAAVVMTLHNYRLLCLPATFLRDHETCELCLGRLPWRGVRYRCYRGSALASAALATSLSLHRAIRTFHGVNRYLAVSEFVRRKYVEAGFAPARITVKPNFAWQGPPRKGPGRHFAFVGRLGPEKGVATLVDAWRVVPAPLLMIGDGPEAPRLRQTAGSNVRFLGPLSAEETADRVSESRALMLPSITYEGSPRVIIEAYSSGVPVVASRIGALPEVVDDGVSGLVVAPGDVDAWAGAAGRLLDDGLSEALGQGALRLWGERFSPEKGLANLETAYREAGAAR